MSIPEHEKPGYRHPPQKPYCKKHNGGRPIGEKCGFECCPDCGSLAHFECDGKGNA